MDSTSADKARLSKEYFSQQERGTDISLDTSNTMWEYQNRQRFQGVPLTEEATNLYVNNTQQLEKALQPVYTVKVWTGYLSPQKQDKKYIQEYQNILQASVQSNVSILNEQKQFRSDIGKFMVVLTYAQQQMSLNPRFSYLKQES